VGSLKELMRSLALFSFIVKHLSHPKRRAGPQGSGKETAVSWPFGQNPFPERKILLWDSFSNVLIQFCTTERTEMTDELPWTTEKQHFWTLVQSNSVHKVFSSSSLNVLDPFWRAERLQEWMDGQRLWPKSPRILRLICNYPSNTSPHNLEN
jgi:hypothetical protein